MVILCFSLKGSENVKKTKRLNKEEIKLLLIDSLVNNNTIERKELNEKAEKVENPEDAADVIKEYEESTAQKGKVLYPSPAIRGK